MREICFDTETTGLSPEEGHKIIEIGCVELIDNRKTNNHFHVYLNPERDISEDSVRITGLTNEFLSDKPLFASIADDFLKFIGDSTLIAHNAAFDIGFLNYELSLLNKENLSNPVVDSLVLARQKFPGQRNNLDALCKRFNIDNSKRSLHGALLDAELLAEVYIELTGGIQNNLIAEQGDEAVSNNILPIDELLSKISMKPIRPSRNFCVNESDLEQHKAFMQSTIKDSLWS